MGKFTQTELGLWVELELKGDGLRVGRIFPRAVCPAEQRVGVQVQAR